MTAERRPRVVVIDDDPHSAKAIRRALPDREIASAATVEHGCQVARAQPPDLVILDFYLPDGTGRDAISRMRADGVSAPVLLISGAFDAAVWSEWAAFEADDFLAKPFDPRVLRDKAERLLRMHELEQRVRRQHDELVALRDRDTREAEAARHLIDRMLDRTDFDPARSRVESLPVNAFGGDVVCGASGKDGVDRWLVGDVAGHTLASALVTIPLAMIFYSAHRRGLSMQETLAIYDRELAAMLPVSVFAAACQCALDRRTGTLTVVNAGCPPVLLRRGDGTVDAIDATRRPFGIAGAHEDGNSIVTVQVCPGDRIYVMTDGLLDVANAMGQAFGPRVRELVAGTPVDDAFASIAAAWRAHVAGAEREDDLTFVEYVV